MEREAGDITKLAVALVFMSALVALIIVMAFTGRKIAYNYIDQAGQIQVDLQNGEIDYIKENDIEVPAASVLALVKANDDMIDELYLDYKDLFGTAMHGRLYDNAGDRTEVYNTFENNIKSKVRLYVVWDSDTSGYDFYIHDLACTSDNMQHSGECPH